MDKSSHTEPSPSPEGATRPRAKWGQERRLEFIDYRLRWGGELNRSDLTGFFGISVPQASLDLAEYSKRAPDNLEYDPSARIYRAASDFVAIFPTSDHARYLEDLLRVAVDSEVPYGSFLGWHPPVSALPRPWRRLEASIVISVVQAIRHSQQLDVRYQSFSDESPSVRSVTPHALVSDGFRWHMRAYCHKRQDFRDFLLSRVLDIAGSKADRDRAGEDDAWHRQVRLVLVPHPELAPAHQALIELDYGMREGQCELKCRQSLLFYVLQQLGLGDPEAVRSPGQQHLALKNRAELAPFLPRSALR
ncbi:Predicted transcriptional regulator [Xanthomonas campestris pv. campestris str. 8004]|uniref:Predicted transcriptional regulator n=1 Tax=Xanthomonas campestris pv. campestris (strain 8004) TaxID=314565 RepID=A0A0H2X8A8_XANC8|nr:Predicted transcriptional regulator [Xanthomonas campestris pv. campestris str. 8004]MBD8246543.1 WYL domain-containing protein [Xanthomonas campestris]QCX68026.1 WYL domain-containing protein [Xanthomonas campestris pv. campestris]QCX71477.1 WYL domain-containing protein [Xanthomonas campestris pv. campestris]